MKNFVVLIVTPVTQARKFHKQTAPYGGCRNVAFRSAKVVHEEVGVAVVWGKHPCLPKRQRGYIHAVGKWKRFSAPPSQARSLRHGLSPER